MGREGDLRNWRKCEERCEDVGCDVVGREWRVRSLMEEIRSKKIEKMLE